jgi:hypothetical protein
MGRVDKKKNRRRGPDSVSRIITRIAGGSWILIFIIFIIISMAKQKTQSLSESFSINFTGQFLVASLVKIAFFLLVFQLGISVFGLILNSRRMKRKNDRYSLSLIFFTAISFLGIVIYFINI